MSRTRTHLAGRGGAAASAAIVGAPAPRRRAARQAMSEQDAERVQAVEDAGPLHAIAARAERTAPAARGSRPCAAAATPAAAWLTVLCVSVDAGCERVGRAHRADAGQRVGDVAPVAAPGRPG